MRLGFSYIGLIYLIMLFVPNIIWAKNQPENYGKYVGNENKLLLTLERIGEVLVSGIVLVFSDFNLGEKRRMSSSEFSEESPPRFWLPYSGLFRLLLPFAMSIM